MTARSGFFPDPRLPDRDWERVLHALELRGTKADDLIRTRLIDQLAVMRQRHDLFLQQMAKHPR